MLIYEEATCDVASDGIVLIEYLEELFERGTRFISEDGDDEKEKGELNMECEIVGYFTKVEVDLLSIVINGTSLSFISLFIN
jgi:hypothetical protein